MALKQDKVSGKGLSTNDYSNEEKDKLAGIATGATAVGKNLAGQSVEITDGTALSTITAVAGAEIFNDYRARTYSDNLYENQGNIASGGFSHAEGAKATASGSYSHAEGYRSISSGEQSHAEGYRCIASGGSGSHAEGSITMASGESTHAEGRETTASGKWSHAEGRETTASLDYSHAEGYRTVSSGYASHSEGQETQATVDQAHAEGYQTIASKNCAHAEGANTAASGKCSHAEGQATKAQGEASHAGGYGTTANKGQTVVGRYNKITAGCNSFSEGTDGDAFIVGNGTGDATKNRTNAFRVAFDGGVYGLKNFSASGAGVAELFEWADGNPDNEDRRGLFVTLDGDKIRIATPDDSYILGMIDPCPFIVGDVHSEIWKNMYQKDIFGEKILETVEVPESTDEEGNIIPAHTEESWVLNPAYDPTKEYVSRDKRKEFAAITSKGKVVMIDDGTCEVNKYCTVGKNGKATASNDNYAVRVLKRIDENHIYVYIDRAFSR